MNEELQEKNKCTEICLICLEDGTQESIEQWCDECRNCYMHATCCAKHYQSCYPDIVSCPMCRSILGSLLDVRIDISNPGCKKRLYWILRVCGVWLCCIITALPVIGNAINFASNWYEIAVNLKNIDLGRCVRIFGELFLFVACIILTVLNAISAWNRLKLLKFKRTKSMLTVVVKKKLQCV